MPRRDGFTLVEISIVIVVIGLIIGGILSGTTLIRSAEIRALYRDVENYRIAVLSFRTKYNALPGDFSRATDFFGTDPDGCASWLGVRSPKTQTCNGNGNGYIEPLSGAVLERSRFWQHLSAAGFIPGLYSGMLGSAPSVRGIHPSITWEMLDYYYFYDPFAPLFAGDGGGQHQHVFYIKDPEEGYSTTGTLSPTEAVQFDAKFDDGKANSGQIRALSQTYGPQGCLNGVDYASDLTASKLCHFAFLERF
ncbi:MAG: prepilin-type N-terminal cleavage/methylation domain-containing protein [Rickettsiales bacterium]|jgi:prepilin-type N-terminal cleavage/methylation domain-containing protein|nr:prepilin-type N-terminal cleavage/methylation domain-containing protein [Rickettsiales bacterium]